MDHALPTATRDGAADFGPWPAHASDEVEAAVRVLRSGRVNYWTGDEGREFEREYAASLGVAHAVALHNGTVALELALVALGIGPGDEVVTTSRTFIASASAIVMRGATPIVVDVDRDSGNVTVETVAPHLTPRTKAVVAVHLGGWPVDIDALRDATKHRGVAVIEDCAQAHGATVRGRPVGSLGDVGAFSFCQDKILTTGGEGGLLVTDDRELWERAWSYKDHGKSHRAVYEADHPPGFRWLHESFGTNWRMLEVQAAIGRVQLRKLGAWSARRRSNAEALSHAFRGAAALRVPEVPEHLGHAYYKLHVYVRPDALRSDWSRDRIMAEVAHRGVPCYSGSCPEIYLERAFTRAGLGPRRRHRVARELGETSLMFLVHPTLGTGAIDRTIDVVESVMRGATR